jgi:drug/metabolite transporter (DMT)-like permease
MVPDVLLGNGLALITAVLWSFNALLFSSAGKRLGPVALNAILITLALVLFIIAHLILFGFSIPSFTWHEMSVILMSGMLGLAVGDFFYFSALVSLGPRKSSLIGVSWPIFAAVLAYFLLDEVLGWTALLGMVLTTAGISWVLLEKADEPKKPTKARYIVYAFLGALCQALGFVLAKEGMTRSGMSPLSVTLGRMLGATVLVWAIVLVSGYMGNVRRAFAKPKGLLFALGGTFTGPFFGVWASMGAALYTKVGIASTIMAMTPILVIPLVAIFYKEKVTLRGMLGAVVAVAGVAVLFLA